MNKEQILLAVVVALTAGIHALDPKYDPVTIREPAPPADVPAIPSLTVRESSPPRPVKRSLFTVKPEYEDPPLVPLAPPPAPEVPVAVPPVRPFPHADASGGFRFRLVDVPLEETPAAPAPEAGSDDVDVVGYGEFVADPEAKKPLDMADFDWVQVKGGFGRSYGTIELLAADVEKGRQKWDLLGDPSLDFTWTQIDPKTGKKLSTAARFRERVEALGFADTLENLYEARVVQERGPRPAPDAEGWKRIAEWIAAESQKPRYDALQGLEYACAALEKALRLRPDSDTVRALGARYRAAYRLDDELRLYDWWFTQQIGQDPEFLALRGQVYDELGLASRALEDYEASLATRPDPATRIRAARLLLRSGSIEDARRAEAFFRRAADDGERIVSAVGLAEALLAQARVAEAEQTLDRVAASDRGPRWYAARAAIHYLHDRLQEAADHFDGVIAAASGAGHEVLALGRTGKAMVQARVAAAAREPRERAEAAARAVALAEEARRDDPFNFYWPLVARAVALRARGDRSEAVDALQEAVAAAPREAYGRYLLGEFYLRDGRPEAARAEFLEASRLAPAFPDAAGGVGRASGGPEGESRDYLRRAVELDPRNPIWYLLAARAGLLAGVTGTDATPEAQRLEEARRDLQELLDRVDARYALGHAHLGYVHYRRGHAEGAIDAWNQALRLILPVRPGTPDEALEKWLRGAREIVDAWMATRIWRDAFLRPDGPQVGNRWKEEEGSGVKITLSDGAAQFGPGRNVRDQDPALWMEWDDQKKILAAYVTLHLERNAQCDGIVDFFIPTGKNQQAALIGLRRKETGEILLRMKTELRDRTVNEVPTSARWPEGGRATFGIRREGTEGAFRVFLVEGDVRDYDASEAMADPRVPGAAGPAILPAPAFANSRGGKFRIQVGTEAAAGAEVLMRVEEVTVWVDVR